MLKIKNLRVSVEGKSILKGVDLLVKPGEIHAIMGPNGSGKSTLAYTLMGHPSYKLTLGKGQAGKISLDGKDILKLTPDQRVKLGLFLAFQYPVSIEGVSVQNFLRKASEVLNGKPKLSVLDFRKRLFKEAEKLGIKKELLKRSLNDGFSGGEKKQVEILQMAILKPKYAILDETDSGLDIDALKVVALGIKKLLGENKDIGIVLITHYQRILRFIKPKFVHVMVNGRIVESGGEELAEKLEKKGYKAYE